MQRWDPQVGADITGRYLKLLLKGYWGGGAALGPAPADFPAFEGVPEKGSLWSHLGSVHETPALSQFPKGVTPEGAEARCWLSFLHEVDIGLASGVGLEL